MLGALITDTLQANFFYFILFHESINNFDEIGLLLKRPTTLKKCTDGHFNVSRQNIKDKKFVHVYPNICVLEVLSTDALQAKKFYFILFFMNP